MDQPGDYASIIRTLMSQNASMQQPEEPEYDVWKDPHWLGLNAIKHPDHREFLNSLKPEQRAMVLKMLREPTAAPSMPLPSLKG
jgi:hypothetical protein